MKSNLSTAKQFFDLIEGNALVISPSLMVVYATADACEYYQIVPDQLPLPLTSLTQFDHLPAILQTVASTLEISKKCANKLLIDQQKQEWEAAFTPLYAAQQQLEYVVVKFTPVPVTSPTALELSAADMQQLLKYGEQMTALYRSDGQPLFFSQQIVDFTGLSQVELAERMFEYLVYPENRAEVLRDFASQLRLDQPFVTELLVRRKDGVYRWLEGHVAPIKSETGTTVKWLGNFTDIHERKEHQRLLEEQITNISNITRLLPQVVWILDFNGLPSFFNQRWYNYTGLSESESMSRNWLKVIHKSDQHLINELFVLAQAEGEIANRELRIISKNNTYRWFLCQVIPIQDSLGDIIKWLGTFTDIQEQKQMEQQKDEFINIASHELKTPLTSIKAYLDIAKNYLDEKTPLSVYVNGARKGTDRLTQLIFSLLDVTRSTDLVDVTRFENFSFQTFIQEVVETFRGAYPKRDISLVGETAVPVYGDPQRLEQVLHNLLTNAVKYTTPNAAIKVHIRQKSANFIEVAVEDWGIGIPEKELKNIFKRYYRVKSDRLVSGFGLGLYICRKIVEAHGGWIFAESNVGVGTRLIFTLPISVDSVT